jgi:precorrin-6A synthase
VRLQEFDLPARDGAASYRAGVAAWHDRVADTYRELAAATAPDAVIALLVWGDPSLYDSTLRILERLRRVAGFAFEVTVVPGVTSLSALAAAHRVALNVVGGPVHVTTGRRLREEGMPAGASVAVMLDGEAAFRGLPDDVTIWWGASLGMADEVAIAGRLGEVRERILEVRERERRRKGWLMDTYLLRREDDP